MARKRTKHDARTLGAPPGSLAATPDASPTSVTITSHSADACDDLPLEALDTVARDRSADATLWVSITGLQDASLIRKLGGLFGLHPLALEDVVHVHQRAKVESYGDSVFVVCRMLQHVDDDVKQQQFSMFFGTGFVVTFQEAPGDCLGPVRDRIGKGQGRIRSAGADYLAYAILDAIVDNYFPVLEAAGERIDALEVRALGTTSGDIVSQIHRTKTDLLDLRRTAWPLRDALDGLRQDAMSLVADDTRTYLRDCHDHVVQIIDLLETYREQCSDLVNLHLAGVSNRTNEIMKVLTVIATIFIPLSFIAGVYGMNFDTDASALNMPELRWAWGYPFAIGLMLVSALGMLGYFRWKKWL